jgi:hypothetical protein
MVDMSIFMCQGAATSGTNSGAVHATFDDGGVFDNFVCLQLCILEVFIPINDQKFAS